MDPKLKESKLRKSAKSVIVDSNHKEEIKHILSKLKLSEEEVIQSYVNYDMDVFAYENEIYESLAMRAVLHLHNLLKGSWHQNRQQTILEMLQKISPKSAVDIGFGVPTKYIKELVLKEKKLKITLIDLYDSAFEFSEILLDYWNPSWKELINFKKMDMDDQEFVGEFDVYIFQDSIEHTKDPTTYLIKTVQLSPNNSKFILSLPIGPKVPAHYISWNNKKEAEEWLSKCGLKINYSKKVYINPEVDLFADQLDKEFYNLIVECTKIII